jgi:serine/threonine-protein kinase
MRRAAAIDQQVERIVASPVFLRAERMAHFLRFIVERAVAGEQGDLKETLIGNAVYGRPIAYDPKKDPIVRVDARRLRDKLREYYETAGRHDPIRIEVPTGSYIPEFLTTAAPLASIPTATIAVLPFSNLGPDPADAYIADGLADGLIHSLARDASLRVVARTTAFQFRGVETSFADIGRRLRSEFLLEGSVRRDTPERIRVTAQLFRAESGYVLWSESYDLAAEALFTVQNEIASAIGAFLRMLFERPEAPLQRKYTPKPESHRLYLQGLFFWNKQTAEGLQKGLELFRQAVGADPEYAIAHTGLAYANVLLGNWGVAPPAAVYPAARAATEAALRLDPDLAEAHLALGAIHCFYDWNWDEGAKRIERAIRLSPSNPQARHARALAYRLPLGDLDGAVEGMREALDLDPLSLFLGADLASALFFARRFDESLAQAERVLEMDRHYQLAHMYRGMSLHQLNRVPEAAEAFARAIDIAASGAWLIGWAGHCFARAGWLDKARALGDLLDTQHAAGRHVTPLDYAALHLGFGRVEQTLECLEQACDERSGLLVWAAVEPRFDEIRDHPRFHRIVERMNLLSARESSALPARTLAE